MIANINTVAFLGINTISIDVQVHVANGIPAFNIVGLPDKIVAESRIRIKAALTSINIPIPAKRITVNLSPAHLPKEGSHYDLPIAIGLLIIAKAIPGFVANNYIIVGELSLDGSIISVPGILPSAIHAKKEQKNVIIPKDDANEASLIHVAEILPVKNLIELISHFKGDILIKQPVRNDNYPKEQNVPDMKDVKGHSIPKRALEIAAAGNHNLRMIGPPGTGKSMLAKRLIGILPDLNEQEIMEINVISSITKRFNGSMEVFRPFREPHTSCSVAAMVGGGKNANPGEITMAHNGILFLDELPEFSRSVLDSLRQPIENKNVTISRANHHITYPANFQLIVAMNPCHCGYLGNLNKSCSKAPKCGVEYQSKISGPILDRIDIHVEVSNINIAKINRCF